MLLKTSESDVAILHTADDFARFFRSKVNNICRATANAPLSMIADRSCRQLSAFDDVSAEEVLKIVTKAPTKHCCLDPAPTWLVKRLVPVRAEMLAKICNASFHEGIFPANLKEAVVCPRSLRGERAPSLVLIALPPRTLALLVHTQHRCTGQIPHPPTVTWSAACVTHGSDPSTQPAGIQLSLSSPMVSDRC